MRPVPATHTVPRPRLHVALLALVYLSLAASLVYGSLPASLALLLLLLLAHAFSLTNCVRTEAELRRREVTARNCSDALLKARTRFDLSQAIEQSPASIVITNLRGDIEYVNRRFTELTGYAASEVLGRNLRLLKSGQTPPETYRALWDAITAGHEWRGDLLNRKKDGSLFWEHALISPIENAQGETTHFLGIKEDMTERMHAVEALRTSREQLRALAGRVQAAREEERTHVAREIHDVLAQELTRLKIDLTSILRRLTRPGAVVTPSELAPRVVEMCQFTDAAVRSVQKIATELRPVVLDSLGLAAAVEWHARDFQRHTGIPCHTSINDAGIAPDRATATAAYRVLQESLTNVARHANASNVAVLLQHEPGWLCLTIRDDGRGISPGAQDAPQSIGLAGMRERAVLLEGTLRIHGEPGAGTTVELRLPLPHTPAPPAS